MTAENSTGPGHPPGTASQLAEASGELVPMSFPGARRVAGLLFWVVFPVLCLGALALSAHNIADHIGDRPTGIRGTFVVSPRTCVQGICSFGGLFTSDDGSIKNLPLLGDPRWHSRDVHHVVYDPSSVEVTALPGHWDATPSVLAALGAVAYLGLVGSLARGARRERPQ
ncbi:hypothetical protein [Jatrophihabitans sp.]|uniref:hypothetical protein n=1 Tax=Jatrophihabitans sp. TaxID=1932789 RepID=UPI002B91CA1E|nr:hypothetical protein [Jatrophihabitans sp.]